MIPAGVFFYLTLSCKLDYPSNEGSTCKSVADSILLESARSPTRTFQQSEKQNGLSSTACNGFRGVVVGPAMTTWVSKFAFATALFAVPLASSAAELRGSVTGPNGTPVSGAKVSLIGSTAAGWTDASGVYHLAEVPAGEHVLSAVAEDFEPVSIEIQVPATKSLEIGLQFKVLRSIATTIEVVGRTDEILTEIPGSVFLISKQELHETKPLDANEVLKKVPGVTLREDSGPMAMRLNVGMRGLNPDRSRKVLMLEDGLPISLAPYGEPEMYYSPSIDRMERVEVLKGSGQIAHGPQTVGGVINFVTRDPPSKFHGRFDLEGGQRGLFVGNGSMGGSNKNQSAGWFVNYLHKQGDGWRDFWFDIEDVQSKFTFKPNDKHTLSIKAGVYKEKSNSTYLGLTQPMFDRDPAQNAVPGDDLKVGRESGSLSHTYVLNPHALWSTSVFAYHTVRNWGRQDWDRSDQGRDYLGVFGDDSIPGGAVFLRDSAGNRNREFYVAGVQSGLSIDHDFGGRRNKLDLGLRYIYEKAGDQRIDAPGFRARSGDIRDDEDRFGKAFSGFVQNRFYLGDRWIVTPGVRFEHYNQQRHITRTRVRTEQGNIPTDVDRRQDNGVKAVVPGLGVSFKATEKLTLFTGVHRGFAPPRTKIAITSSAENLNLDAELSWNYEAGARFTGSRALQAEFTFFRLDFSNQIITAAESGGATTTLANGGATLHQGFESSVRVNWSELASTGGWTISTDFRHMYLPTAEFSNNRLFGGNRLPYAPANTLSVLFGLRHRHGLGFQIDLSRIADQFGDNGETVLGSADGTVGRLPSYQVANLMVDYRIRRERWEFTPYFTIKNVANQLYIASRAPQGIQPGLVRQTNFGLKISF
jgi:Fe(3+) dicitrate transport protein